MNKNELEFTKNLDGEELKTQVEDEILTLSELGFALKNYTPNVLKYTKVVYGDNRIQPVIIFLRNPVLYKPGVQHIAVWINGNAVCNTDTLDQALEELVD